MLKNSLRYLVRITLTFCLIVAVLVAGRWAWNEWKSFKAVKQDVLTLEQGDQALRTSTNALKSETSARANRLQTASDDVLSARILAIDEKIRTLSAMQDGGLIAFPLQGEGQMAQKLVARSQRMIEIELLSQERDFLMRLRAASNAALSRNAAAPELARLHAAHVAAYRAVIENLRAQAQLKSDSFIMSHLPGSAEYRTRTRLLHEQEELIALNNQANKAYQYQLAAITRMGSPERPLQFAVNEVRVNAIHGQLGDVIALGKNYTEKNWAGKSADAVREVAPAALMILLSLIMLPIVIKVVFYYVLAPLAQRRPAFIVDANTTGLLTFHDGQEIAGRNMGNKSAPSAKITLSEGEELLIQPGCIQSSSHAVKSDTQWLLDWSCPFTSLAAGLYALTRIVAEKPASIVVSPALDPLSEIAVLHLPAGAAMVFQPRALAGVVHLRGQPLHISRHWRLWSLHAWLTLQLRYLVFRGPVTLIVKGCRGVRVDEVSHGRVISQSATLGFSTNAAYSTSRAQTFFPYLMGHCALLNDRFEGAAGFCVYEESAPSPSERGVVGRGLDGLTDSVLKIFGV